MNHLHARRALAVLLVLCMLVVGGLASAQSISHESHHAHHQKAAHGTVLCSWMCAAGHMLDGSAAPDLMERLPVAVLDQAALPFIPHRSLKSATSRGPPSYTTI